MRQHGVSTSPNNGVGRTTRLDSVPRYVAPAAACAADVLHHLARTARPASIAELARSIGCTKSLAFRVVNELEARQLLRKTDRNQFWLGLGALEIGGAYAANADYADGMRRALSELAGRFGETAHLGVLQGTDVFYVMNEQAPDAIVGISYAGKRLPANCTALGKALLARLADSEVEERFGGDYPRLTSRSVTDPDVLRAQLARARADGYATVDGEAILGRFAVALCVDVSGLADPAAIAVSGSADVLAERREEIADALQRARAFLEREGVARSALESMHPAAAPAGAGIPG